MQVQSNIGILEEEIFSTFGHEHQNPGAIFDKEV